MTKFTHAQESTFPLTIQRKSVVNLASLGRKLGNFHFHYSNGSVCLCMELLRYSFHMWVESVGSNLLCSKRFIVEAPSLVKTNI